MSDQYLRTVRSLVKALDALKASLDQYENTKRENQQTAHNQNQQPPPIEIRSELSLPVPVREYYEAEQRERQSAWRKIKAGLEILGVTIAVILAALTYYTLQKVSSQADSAQKQVRIMQRQLEATDRPWIQVLSAEPVRDLEIPRSSNEKKNGVAMGEIKIRVQNVGRSVANDAFARGILTFTPDLDRLREEQKIACSGAVFTVPVPLPRNIFPNDRDVMNEFIVYGAIEVPQNEAGIELAFVGCISYRISGFETRHHSSFMYGLARKPEVEFVPPSYLFHIGQNVSAKDLIVTPYRSGFDSD